METKAINFSEAAQECVEALTHQREIYPNSAYESLSEELQSRKDLALLELQAPDNLPMNCWMMMK